MFGNQGVHTDREVTTHRPDIINTHKKKGSMNTKRCGNTCGQKCHAKGSRQETNIQEFKYRDTTNVEHEMYDNIGNNWSHQNSNKRFREKLGSHTRKTFSKFTTKYSYIRNITQYGEYCNLKLEG